MRRIIAARILTVSFISASLIGCTQRIITEYRAEPGNSVSISKLTQDEYWKRQVDDHIRAELAGQDPEGGHDTWRAYYEWWYSVLRRKPKPPWKSAEFKTSEDLVNYIKATRRAKGLPSYEP